MGVDQPRFTFPNDYKFHYPELSAMFDPRPANSGTGVLKKGLDSVPDSELSKPED